MVSETKVSPVNAGERLSAAEEQTLAQRLKGGDESAAERLVVSYLPFVVATARRYSRYGLPLNELVQEGVVGLIRAVRRFNPDQDARLASYASWWVRAAIHDHIIGSWSLVRVGTTAAQKALFFRLRRMATDLGSGFDEGEEAIRRLAAKFQVTTGEVMALARRVAGRDRSLNQPAPGGDGEWISQLVDRRPSPEEAVAQKSEHRFWQGLLDQAMASLPPREREIIRRRYLADARASFESISRELDLSKERVRQLEARALGELRAFLARAVPSRPSFG
ncbi:MAG: sigma-70 family RNA polymerase sigma factor [Alphaproteobacteria bacterium]|nr:sigma-70 family RNA polymerase sigma factor [Alphaproteobacteria bacterium]